MNDIQMIPLGKLRLSEANVRKNDSNLFIDGSVPLTFNQPPEGVMSLLGDGVPHGNRLIGVLESPAKRKSRSII